MEPVFILIIALFDLGVNTVYEGGESSLLRQFPIDQI